MYAPSLVQKAQFHTFVVAPFILAIIIIAFFYGCQQNPPEKKETGPVVTIENLQTAYNKASNYAHMYQLFAARAEKDRLKNVAALYAAIARSEEIHAKVHADLLKARGVTVKTNPPDSIPVGSTVQTIKLALSSEDIEVGSMYPNLARTAEAEQFKEAADQFTHVRDADARQQELLQIASNDLAKFPKYTFQLCDGCGYLVNSDKTDECPVCGHKKQTFVKV